MSTETKREVNWNDKPLLIRSTIVGLFFWGLLLVIGEHAKPPEGYVFQRLPTESGVYQCCGSGGRTSWSLVGSVYADCASMEFFPYTGLSWHDCGHKEELVGRIVEIERTTVPRMFSSESSAVVIKLSTGGNTYFEYSDQQIRERWIDRMRGGAFSSALSIALIFQLIQLVYLGCKSKKLPA